MRIRRVGEQRTVYPAAGRHQLPAGPVFAVPQSRILLVMPSGEPVHTGTCFFQAPGRLLRRAYFLSLRVRHADTEAL